jgi:hypothetical protein
MSMQEYRGDIVDAVVHADHARIKLWAVRVQLEERLRQAEPLSSEEHEVFEALMAVSRAHKAMIDAMGQFPREILGEAKSRDGVRPRPEAEADGEDVDVVEYPDMSAVPA